MHSPACRSWPASLPPRTPERRLPLPSQVPAGSSRQHTARAPCTFTWKNGPSLPIGQLSVPYWVAWAQGPPEPQTRVTLRQSTRLSKCVEATLGWARGRGSCHRDTNRSVTSSFGCLTARRVVASPSRRAHVLLQGWSWWHGSPSTSRWPPLGFGRCSCAFGWLTGRLVAGHHQAWGGRSHPRRHYCEPRPPLTPLATPPRLQARPFHVIMATRPGPT